MSAPGPLGEEARLLVEAAREWAARTFPDADAHVATGSPECCWCPLCRAVAAVRSPETAERVAGAVTAAATALAAVLDSLTAPKDPPGPGTGPPDPGSPGAGRPGPAAGPPDPAAGPPGAGPRDVQPPSVPFPQPIPLDDD